MLRQLRSAVLFGLLGCAAGIGQSAQGAGLYSSPVRPSVAAMPQWPVLRDAAQSTLGLYGGVVSAFTIGGELESATLLILPTGYTAPVLGGGGLATFNIAYFDQPGCKGREYLAPAGQQPGLLPFAGIVYRSAATGQPAYIAQGRQPASVLVRSVLHLDAQQGIRCEPLQQTLPLLSVEPNDPMVTGMNRDGEFGPVSLGIDSGAAVMAGKRDRRSPAEAVSEPPGRAEEMAEESQEECSPGCLAEAVGNGSCDIACYFESCRFDGDDCADMNREELDAALANMCSPGCSREDVGDGFCDAACRTEACSQDGGDCEQNGNR